MADPVSLAGLTLQVIEAASTAYKYGRHVKNAHNEIKDLLGELYALKAILDQMTSEQRGRSKPDTCSVQSFWLGSQDEALDNANTVLSETLEALEKVAIRGPSFLKQLGWPGRRAKLQENLGHLERIKSYFILVMMNKGPTIGRQIPQSIDALMNTTQQIERSSRLDRQRSLREWLCPIDVESIHRGAQSVCQAGTGRWFINSWFQQWSRPENGCKFLHLQGKSGSGKTILCSTAIEAARATEKIDAVGVLYFYCSFQSNTSQTLVHLLGSFVAQLSESYPDILDQFANNFIKRSFPTPETLVRVLVEHARQWQKLFLFVDAVNESSETEDILNTLVTLTDSIDRIQVMTTSTAPLIEIPNVTLLQVHMRPTSNWEDIDAFVNTQLTLRTTLRRLPQHMKEKIRQLLLIKAGGMFRYGQCQIDLLSAQRSGRDVLRSLDTMPDSLYGTYEVILSHIPPQDRYLAREAMLWTTYSLDPLTLAALNEALVLERGDRFVDNDCRLFNTNVILHACQGLVVYNEATTTVALAHSSVPAFLTSDAVRHSPAAFYRLESLTATRVIYQKCLTYLMFDEFRQPCLDEHSLNQRLMGFPLLEYAACAWASLCGAYSPPGFELSEPECEEIMAFFGTVSLKQGGNFRSWVQVLQSHASSPTVWTTEPLYYAASFGILPAVDRLIENGAWVDAHGGFGGATALNIASFRGHYFVVKRLLEAGADPNSEDNFRMTSVEWARRDNRHDIVQLLLEYGADERLIQSPKVA